MEEEYMPSILVTFYHSLPHVNLTLQFVNSTFNPKSNAYLEVPLVCYISWNWCVDFSVFAVSRCSS